MKFVIAPDKFKGSLTGFEFCNAVENGIRQVIPSAEIIKMPLADGGDGTIDVVQHYIKGEKTMVRVQDPLQRPIDAPYLYSRESRIAYIEMAEASGLWLLSPNERNCMHTTTFGTGQLIAHALELGAQELILGIGGSATNDGGMGMAMALGYRFLDVKGKELEPIGANLIHVHTIEEDQKAKELEKVSVKIACDVSNPFYGPNGAAYIYGAQKGASAAEIELLDQGLRNFAHVIERTFNTPIHEVAGAGAAGGIGGGALVFLNASMASGIDLIKELADFDNAIKGADWILTGEGQLDGQTLSGKTIDGVMKAAKAVKIPVAAFCGSLAIDRELQEALGITYATSIIKGIVNLEEAMEESFINLEFAAYNFAQLL
ncbi:glycerate kinase [Euzebyella saccharophila]|uniref:Glycerate kinase n=1 Tax=Euzebyella saccharophila TaxID=679664 RepID=A0ABV8JRS4_9FLAO|nr:glycerate kinase [Euzebyella saccharophila]